MHQNLALQTFIYINLFFHAKYFKYDLITIKFHYVTLIFIAL